MKKRGYLEKELIAIKRTNIFEKAAASFINMILIFIISIPLFLYFGWSTVFKLSVIGLFLIYSLVFHMRHNHRCIGMRIIKTHWERNYSAKHNLIYSFLYTLSFSTIFIWVFFPLDVFMLNMILQTICIFITGTTIHGYLSGGMHTVKHRK